MAIIGAGVRGTSLARKLTLSGFGAKVVAVAEPDAEKRNSFVKEFNLPGEAAFGGWNSLVSDLKECDAAIIATLDNQHTGPALASLKRGWHILIEKPLADTFEDCIRIVEAQKKSSKVVAVCHTLRFMEGFRKVKEILDSGRIGRLIHLDHMEAISNQRFAHNYVRGRWAQEKNNTFLLLHKCSHDIDWLSWLVNGSCIRVSSFGSLSWFTPANAPAGAVSRCTDGCKIIETCPYSSLRLYLDTNLNEWPARDICLIHSRDEHLNAVRTGPYGKCVWYAGNDVVDHQIVMMEFREGVTASCTLTGYSATNGRRTRIQGTDGELVFDEAAGIITASRFDEKNQEVIEIGKSDKYHPEDRDIVDDWLSSVINSTSVVVDAAEALRTHAIVFAAEISRKDIRTIEMSEMTVK